MDELETNYEEPRPTGDSYSGVDREEGQDATEAEKAHVKYWLDEIKRSEKHFESAFKRMREDMDFAYKHGIGAQWPGQSSGDDRYIANFIQRHVQSRVSSLYAKNPKAIYQRRQRLDFALWDGTPESIEEALMQLEMYASQGLNAPYEVLALLQDIQQGLSTRQMLDRLGRTLEILFNYSVQEQQPSFKQQMKQMIRRVQTCGIAYVRPGYQRTDSRTPDSQARVADIRTRIYHLQQLQQDFFDGEILQDSPEVQDLRVTLQELEKEGDLLLREGLTFDFPRATSIIFDRRTTQIVGWVGTGWVAEKWVLPPKEIQSLWGKDIGQNYKKYEYSAIDNQPRAMVFGRDDEAKKGLACVYKVYDKKSGTAFVVCDGYQGYVSPPGTPEVKVEQFFPIYPLAFNQIEHENEVYPPSDVRLLMHQQKEYNRSKEALRQHRIANRPLYVTPNGALEEEDARSLASYASHEVIELNGLKEGQAAQQLLQPVQKVPIDPNVYETNQIFTDVTRVVGAQEANLGGTSGASATETSIAESSRMSTLSSNVDDLDDLLTDLARAGGQIMLRNMPVELVKEIAGPGAVWPQLTSEQLVKEVWLEIEAGSSGRPNRAQELADFERVAPFMLQIPGVRPSWLGKYLLRILDSRIEFDEAISSGLPSITSINRMAQVGTGDPMTDPNQQAIAGADNAPQPEQTAPGPQPAFPSSGGFVA